MIDFQCRVLLTRAAVAPLLAFYGGDQNVKETECRALATFLLIRERMMRLR